MRKILAFSSLTTFIFYLMLELSFSILYINGVIYPSSVWLYEESDRTVHFDPIRGYTLTPVPSRFVRITYGDIEYIGTLQGNNYGLPDRDDFFPNRKKPETLRFAVLGDSFSAAQFIKKNWPDTVEDLAEQSGLSLELLNFSIDGGGLANWWSLLTGIIQKEQFQLDGLIFAVFGHDLQRGFTIAEHRGYSRHMFTQLHEWNPEKWPKSVEEARAALTALDGYIVSHEEFEQAIQKKQLPRAWRPYLSLKIMNRLKLLMSSLQKTLSKSEEPLQHEPEETSEQRPQEVFNSEQIMMMQQIREFVQEKSLPVLVIRVPKKEGILQKVPPREDHLQFSSALGATFIDGSTPFLGLNDDEVQDQFFPYDGHWNQTGSDRFAHFMFEQLKTTF